MHVIPLALVVRDVWWSLSVLSGNPRYPTSVISYLLLYPCGGVGILARISGV